MTIELVLVTPDGEQRPFPVSRARIIGRDEDCDLRVPVAEVSREHCRVEPNSSGGLTVEDLGSSNGTFINGLQVDEADMTPGDVLKIGPAFLVLRVDGQPAAIDAHQAIERGTPSALASPAKPAPKTSKQVGQAPLVDEDDEDLFSDFDFDDDEGEAPKL
ncbi:MAG: FHA domain-containing protein [Phycisphaeraceae bacterium]|nr:FHA domain-containing protein [Phycisphaeraceae bacterium]